MAYKAKDGRQFGNRQKQKAYDERESTHAAKDEHEQPDSEGETHGESDEPIQEFVAQHGPAEKIEIEHDHEAGKHTVTSHHGGMKHHSTHPNAEAAHVHAAHAAGLNLEQHEQPEQTTQPAPEQGYGIPGM